MSIINSTTTPATRALPGMAIAQRFLNVYTLHDDTPLTAAEQEDMNCYISRRVNEDTNNELDAILIQAEVKVSAGVTMRELDTILNKVGLY